MQMMGSLLLWMVWIRSWMPPRSPPDMPSTSSITSSCLRLCWPGPPSAAKMVVLVAISLIMLAVLPPMPSEILLSALLRVSLAFISTTSKPHSLAIMCAELVFPMPGEPLRRMAFLPMSLALPPPGAARGSIPLRCTSSHCCSHTRRVATSVLLPTSSDELRGLYLSTHSSPSFEPAAAWLDRAGLSAAAAAAGRAAPRPAAGLLLPEPKKLPEGTGPGTVTPEVGAEA
mmetsp:Transcript_40656/g.90395  ORF Transcript_40656/g.90395 Transcript_40656/m.90395 type:complete len:229 (+) Transcript_40656:1242-1928(+)